MGVRFLPSGGGIKKAFSSFFSTLESSAHKDRSPRETVEYARELLRRVGIFPIERDWYSFGTYFHSVRLTDQELPIAVNGKGVTREFALASAYGELMERLQNGRVLPETYGLMPRRDRERDGRMVKLSVLRSRQGGVVDALLAPPLPAASGEMSLREKIWCVPFYNVTNGAMVDLPIDYISQVCSSNGLCAGNTPEEALVEGLCEIAERHVMRKILLGEYVSVPTIPIDEIKVPSVRAKIQDLSELGYSVTVKDCTMGGRFPVLAAIITSDKRQGYMSRFGSSPDFTLALERCLTEAFQGVNSSEAVPDLRPLMFNDQVKARKGTAAAGESAYASFYSEYRNGSGRLPRSMFFSNAKPAHETAFLKTYHSNRNALKHMLDCFRMNGAPVYVRDSSHLGFPAFRIYVPGFTEISVLNKDIPVHSYRLRQKLGRDLLKLKKHSAKKVRALALGLERLFACPVVGFESSRFMPALMEVMLTLWLKRPNDLEELASSRDKLLAILFHRAADYTKAARYFRMHLESHPDEAVGYTTCCLAYFILKAGTRRVESLRANLVSFFGRELAEEVISDLKDSDNAFRYYQLPDCGDCSRCEIKDACLYPAWKKVRTAYEAIVKQNPIRQEALENVFYSGSRLQ
jgi:ribosomal protein S12 methylthiotransferase accessory factor